MADTLTPDAIREFWFGGPDPLAADLEERIDLWFAAPPEIDREIARRFGDAVRDALAERLDAWEDTPADRLSLIILLDQFTRNIYRGTPPAYAGDEHARTLALECIDRHMDRRLSIVERAFVYMPLQHAEDAGLQRHSVRAFENLVREAEGELQKHMQRFLASAQTHLDIIARFGRFPHRNEIFGRECTPDETDFLRTPPAPFRAKS